MSYNPEVDIKLAVEMIIKAFEKKTTELENKISTLNYTVQEKEGEIEDLNKTIKKIGKELSNLREQNFKIKQENEYLIEATQRLNNENDKLHMFKNTMVQNFDSDVSKMNKIQLETIFKTKNKKEDYEDFKSYRSNTIQKEHIDTSPINELLNNLNFNLNNNQEIRSINSTFDEQEKKSKNGFAKKVEDIKLKFKRIKTIDSGIENTLNTFGSPFSSKSMTSLRKEMETKQNQCQTEPNQTKNYEGKSQQYILANKFFNECKIMLKPEGYETLIQVLKERNDNRVTEDEVFRKVYDVLKNNPRLLKDFKNIFPLV